MPPPAPDATMLGRFAPAIALLLAFKLRIVRRSVRFAIKVVAGKLQAPATLPDLCAACCAAYAQA